MLAEMPGEKLNTYIQDYVVFDLETTGTSVRTDAVVEISAVKVCAGKVIDEFSTLVNPERPMSYMASCVNGITDEMVEDSPVFETALQDFLEFAGDSVLVGHNIARFDMKFLYRDSMTYWGKTVSNNYIDTLTLARQYLPALGHYKLTDLAGYYGISAQGAHRALNDCRMNQKVFEYLGKEIKNAASNWIELCPRCGQPLTKRNGRYGSFWGCSGFPKCRYTRNG